MFSSQCLRIGGLYTDFYELVMAECYYLNGEKDRPSCFDYFFRKAPLNSSYAVFAGLDTLLSFLEAFTFSQEDLEFLGGLGFKKPFLKHLEQFRFQGTVHAMQEGEIVFSGEPIIRVEGNIIENRLI